MYSAWRLLSLQAGVIGMPQNGGPIIRSARISAPDTQFSSLGSDLKRWNTPFGERGERESVKWMVQKICMYEIVRRVKNKYALFYLFTIIFSMSTYPVGIDDSLQDKPLVSDGHHVTHGTGTNDY